MILLADILSKGPLVRCWLYIYLQVALIRFYRTGRLILAPGSDSSKEIIRIITNKISKSLN